MFHDLQNFPFSSFIVLFYSFGPGSFCKPGHHVHELHNRPSLNDEPRMAASVRLFTQRPITFQLAEKTLSWLYVGGGLPPVTAKLAKHIQDSQFIKMV